MSRVQFVWNSSMKRKSEELDGAAPSVLHETVALSTVEEEEEEEDTSPVDFVEAWSGEYPAAEDHADLSQDTEGPEEEEEDPMDVDSFFIEPVLLTPPLAGTISPPFSLVAAQASVEMPPFCLPPALHSFK